ncbi:MAG: hypothetical protein KAG06_08160 [Methylococcales bacterium]|nr:hypothetical protein [Methylococcales bacterium]
MTILFTFLKERFQSMPQWVQVSTYLTFVVLFVYLFTAPRFLDMRLVSNDYGDEFPIGGAQIEIEIEGRVLTLLTDSKGRFSVPITTSAPIGSYLFILSPDSNSNKIKEIEVPVSNSYLKRSKIIYSKKTNDYQIIPNGIIQNTKKILSSIRFISTAYANGTIDKGIANEILNALEVITEISSRQISKNVSIRDDLNLDNIDLSYINNRLSKKYNIDCLSVFQHEAKTVGDLIEIAKKLYYQNRPSSQTTPATSENSEVKTRSFGAPMTLAAPKARIVASPIEISPQLMIKYKLGKVLRKSERYDLALDIFKKITQEQPRFYEAWFHLALTYAALSQNELAEGAFRSAIAYVNGEKDDRLYHSYGMFLFKQERYKEAGVQFKIEERLKR